MSGFFLTDQCFVGRCHPAVRLIGLFLACIPPLLINEPRPAAILIALYLWVTLRAGAGRNLWRIKWLIVLFLAMALIMWPAFYHIPGPPLFRLGPLAPSAASLSFALAMGLRLIALLMVGIIFLSCSRIEDISHGMQQLGIPYRAAFTFSLAFRLTPLFLETAGQIAAAQKARGLDLENVGVFRRLKGYVAIVAPVLITALRRAEGLALALESKGFGRSTVRSSIVCHRASWRDPALLLTLAALTLATGCWRWDVGGVRAILEAILLQVGPG
jgi:energy-coupling factor transport system permease protein